MSYDESDEDGEWEVVDIVHTTTSLKPDKKSKPAKQEDVDKLANDIRTQLTLKTTHDTQQMMLLEQKLRQQKEISDQQLATIQSKLNEITRVQQQQKLQQNDLDKQRRNLDNKQKQQLLEQQIQIQSLSDHQMLTQKQILEAHQKIKHTQKVTANVNENIQSLQQLQQQQHMQKQFTEQQAMQQQLAQLAQITAQQQLQQQQQQQQQQQNMNMNMNMNNMNNTAPQLQPISQPIDANNNNNNNSNNNNTNMNGKNSWLPSFFVFGNNKNGSGKGNINIQDMDMGTTPPPPPINNYNKMNPEEKEPILMDDDDDDVLRWNNDYGSNPLYNNPKLLKTKATIGEGKFAPCEKRQCGWILVNKGQNMLKLSAKLECIGGDKEEYGIKVTTEKCYEFSLKPNEEIYILIEVEAPPIIGKYCAFYRLIIDNGIKIGEMLEVMCHVNSQYSEKKENKITQVIKMGFNDRKKVIQTLKKKKWNIQQTVDTLIGL